MGNAALEGGSHGSQVAEDATGGARAVRSVPGLFLECGDTEALTLGRERSDLPGEEVAGQGGEGTGGDAVCNDWVRV